MILENYLDDPFSPRYTQLPEKAEPKKYPPIEEQLIKVTDKKRKPKEGVTSIEKDANSKIYL